MMRARAKILEGTFLSPNFVYFNLCIIQKTRLLMIFLSNSSFKNFGGTKWDSSSWERLLGNKGCWRSPYSPVASPRTEMGALHFTVWIGVRQCWRQCCFITSPSSRCCSSWTFIGLWSRIRIGVRQVVVGPIKTIHFPLFQKWNYLWSWTQVKDCDQSHFWFTTGQGSTCHCHPGWQDMQTKVPSGQQNLDFELRKWIELYIAFHKVWSRIRNCQCWRQVYDQIVENLLWIMIFF